MAFQSLLIGRASCLGFPMTTTNVFYGEDGFEACLPCQANSKGMFTVCFRKETSISLVSVLDNGIWYEVRSLAAAYLLANTWCLV